MRAHLLRQRIFRALNICGLRSHHTRYSLFPEVCRSCGRLVSEGHLFGKSVTRKKLAKHDPFSQVFYVRYYTIK